MMARGFSAGAASAALLIVFLQVAPHFARRAHLLLKALVEALRRIDAAVFEQMIQSDDFGDDGNVLSRVERNADLGNLDVEDGRRLAIESRAIRRCILVPLLELHDDLDAFL